MGINPAQLRQAAEDIRSAESALTAIASELHSTSIWSGADSDKFQDEWESMVRGRLLGAARSLDAAEFTSL
jgi:uncharacterized protein YukE